MRRRLDRNWSRAGLGLLLAVAVFATSGQATEKVQFTVPGAAKGLEASLKSASGLMQIEAAGDADAQDLFAAARADYARLIGALYGEGYYSPVIRILLDGREAAGIAPLDAPGRIKTIQVIVEPGPLFTFSQAEVTPLAPGTELPSGFRKRETAKSGLITGAVAAGIEGWRDLGHAKARSGSEAVSADHARARLSARIALDPGPRLRFGSLQVEGQNRMREDRIREIAGLPEGEVFSPDAVRKSAERLRRTGVFSSVTLTEDEAVTAPDKLGFTLTVAEQKRRRFGFGAEIASTSGLELSGFWLHRNLFGGAERLRIEGTIEDIAASDSGIDYHLGVTLDRPATFTPDTTLTFSSDIARLSETDFDADAFTISIGVSHILSETLTGRIGIGYDYINGSDVTGDFEYQNLSLPIGLTWDKRDNPINASEGFFVDGEVKPFLGFDVTDSGGRLTFDGRAYHGFGGTKDRRKLVLAGRVQAGAILGASLLGTPRDFLFYSGGGGTVRGQPYESLGVDVAENGGSTFRTGGTHFLGASVEVRTMVTENIGIVGFADIGQISAFGFDDSSAEVHSGAGLGVRYNTSVGPIRFDVATPVSGKTGDGVQFYIGLGQAF